MTINAAAIVVVCGLSIVTTAHAETMEQCMARKTAALSQVTEQYVHRDQGCTTKGTEWNGSRNSCDASLCWTAPPGTIIVSARAENHSANGSEHSYSGPHYKPDRERAYEVCFNVHARSPSGHINSRGWQKLNVAVQTRHELSNQELQGLAIACAREGAS
ncbi:MAG: hypothetical protein JAY74_10500 [Candidatus Thiodiazotropha taylori]|nr:hypothetical protein [Candidatus Thiodiazotropha taylori]